MNDTATKEIYDKLNELEKRLIRIEDKIANKTEKIIKIEKEIYGNGKDGLTQRITNLEKFEIKVVTIAIMATFIANWLVKFLSR